MAQSDDNISGWDDLERSLGADPFGTGSGEKLSEQSGGQSGARSGGPAAAVAVDLQPILDAIRDLRDSLASYQSLEHSLVELFKVTEFNNRTLTEHVLGVRADIEALRESQPAPDGEAESDMGPGARMRRGLRSLRLWRTRRFLGTPRQRAKVASVSIVLAGILFAAWALRNYLHDGGTFHAAFALVIVNLAGLAAVLVHRRANA